GKLPCLWAEITGSIPAHLDEIAATLTTRKKWDERAWSPPWHPFMMEWEVELRPFTQLAGDAKFFEDNYTLKRTDVDLSSRRGCPDPALKGFSYRGSSLLTPHGVVPYLELLEQERRRGNLLSLRDTEEEPDEGTGEGVRDPHEDKNRPRRSPAERRLL